MNRANKRFLNEVGTSLPLIAVFLAATAAMTGVMIESSRVAMTTNEIQLVADLAAAAALRAQIKGTRTADSGAFAVLQENGTTGLAATRTAIQSIEIGNWTSNTFISNLAPLNAVKATVTGQLDNVSSGAFRTKDAPSTVTKGSVAAFRPLREARATLPIVLGSCTFADTDCFSDSCLPRLTQVPDATSDSAFTAFFENTSSTTINHYLDPCVGGLGHQPRIAVGDHLDVGNDRVNRANALKAIKDMVEICHLRSFLVPVVPCAGKYNQSKPVLGFATIFIDQVVIGGDERGISLHGIFDDVAGEAGEARIYGTGMIDLVELRRLE